MAVWANQVAAGQVADINSALSNLENECANIILALDTELNKASKKTLNKTLSELRNAESAALSKQLTDTLSSIERLTILTAGAEVATLKKLTKRKIESLSAPFKAALDNPIAATGDMLKPFIEGLEATTATRIERTIRAAMANKLTLQETVRSLSDTFDVIKRRDVEAIVQTACHHAFQEARTAVYKANGIKQVECLATLDTRTCFRCAALDGLVVDESKSPRYPLHPRCRCVTLPHIPELSAFDEGATRSSESGYVPAKTTAFEWYRGHGNGWLDDVFGPTIATAIKSPDMTADKFRKLSLDKRYRPASITQIEERLSRRT